MSKGGILIPILAVILFGIGAIIAQDNIENTCIDICESHNYSYYKYDNGFIKEDTCYCNTNDGIEIIKMG